MSDKPRLLSYTRQQLMGLPKQQRIMFLNSLSGFKAAWLLGSKSSTGISNLCVVNSVMHVGASPPLMGLLFRPKTSHHQTQPNIEETGVFTVNLIEASYLKEAHQTAATYGPETSEFTTCGFTEQYLEEFEAPFVQEARIKVGLKLEEMHKVKANGTTFLVASVQHVCFPAVAVGGNGSLNPTKIGGVASVGLTDYYTGIFHSREDYKED